MTRACSCGSWRKEVGEIFSGCWDRNLGGIWQHLFTSSKLCLTAGRKLGARGLEWLPDVWDVLCARSLLLEVKSWSLGTQKYEVLRSWDGLELQGRQMSGYVQVRLCMSPLVPKVAPNTTDPGLVSDDRLAKPSVAAACKDLMEDKNIHLCFRSL